MTHVLEIELWLTKSFQHRNSHCGDKMILWSSYLHNGNYYVVLNQYPVLQSSYLGNRISYTAKTSLYWISLPWRHNGRDSVSNHQPHDCLLNCLFRCRSKKTSKLHVTGLCVGNSPRTGEFPAQRASNVENVSIWWRHHDGSSRPFQSIHHSVFVDHVIMCADCINSDIDVCMRVWWRGQFVRSLNGLLLHVDDYHFNGSAPSCINGVWSPVWHIRQKSFRTRQCVPNCYKLQK